MNSRTPPWRDGLVAIVLLVGSVQAARSAISIYVPPEDLARRAVLIVEGTVRSSESGYEPGSSFVRTYVTIDAETMHRGPAETREVVLREPGGRRGNVVLELDAVPRYVVGERVFVFLEPAGDGALRTVGMFYGKYRIEEDRTTGRRDAVRDLDGAGTIQGHAAPRRERLRRGDLVALANTIEPLPRESVWLARPAEFERLQREPTVPAPPRPTQAVAADPARVMRVAPGDGGSIQVPDFSRLVPNAAARWFAVDGDLPVRVHVDRSRDPLGNASAAVTAVTRAMKAWTDVPESRLRFEVGSTHLDYVSAIPGSPLHVMGGHSVVLFGDPYDDISDPIGCNGVLAVGGYWRSGTLGYTVNNIPFYPVLQLQVIFNNDFECFLGDADNLSEVAAHELGHGIGFGHSDAPDSILRATAYSNRGARLGEDDVDAAHCHYPHALTITNPIGGENWPAGSRQRLAWESSPERGPDPGRIDVEYSVDGSATWTVVSSGEANDGEFVWTVPALTGSAVRLRLVRPHRGDRVPAEYPDACSSATAPGAVNVTEPTVIGPPIPRRRPAATRPGASHRALDRSR